MSTYYNFYCSRCKQAGGFLSRQAWGAGNFDIIETFKFTMYHGMMCGTDAVHMAVEHTDEYSYPSTPLNDMEGIFPSSNDWKFISDRLNHMSWSDLKKAWQLDRETTK